MVCGANTVTPRCGWCGATSGRGWAGFTRSRTLKYIVLALGVGRGAVFVKNG